jgi:hypothetical protein
LVVVTSSPLPVHALPLSATLTPPFVVLPRTDPETSLSEIPPLVVDASRRPATSLALIPPFTDSRRRSVCRGTKTS